MITANSAYFCGKAEEHQAHFPEQCVACEINVSNVHAEKPDYEPAVMLFFVLRGLELNVLVYYINVMLFM